MIEKWAIIIIGKCVIFSSRDIYLGTLTSEHSLPVSVTKTFATFSRPPFIWPEKEYFGDVGADHTTGNTAAIAK